MLIGSTDGFLGDHTKMTPATVQPVAVRRFATDVIAQVFLEEVASESIVTATTTTLISSSSGANVGNIIKFTSGALSGEIFTVVGVLGTTYLIGQQASEAPGIGDTFKIYRYGIPEISGGGIISSGLAPQTATFTKSTVSVEQQIVAANLSRKGGYIQALWANSDNIYLRLSGTATTTDIPLAPGGQFMLTLNYGGAPITNEVRGIAGSGTQGYIVVEA